MVGCRTRTAVSFCFLVTLLVLWATQGICAKKKPPLHPVNLNTASSTELQQVPGIGPATAQKILQARKSYGSFKSVDDLQAIQGIGPKKLAKMRKYLTVSPPTKQASHGATTGKPGALPKDTVTKASPPAKTAASTASEDEEQ